MCSLTDGAWHAGTMHALFKQHAVRDIFTYTLKIDVFLEFRHWQLNVECFADLTKGAAGSTEC